MDSLPWSLRSHSCPVFPGGNEDVPHQPAEAENSSATKALCREEHASPCRGELCKQLHLHTPQREQQGSLPLPALWEQSRETALLRGGEFMCLRTTPHIAFLPFACSPVQNLLLEISKAFSSAAHAALEKYYLPPRFSDKSEKLFCYPQQLLSPLLASGFGYV